MPRNLTDGGATICVTGDGNDRADQAARKNADDLSPNAEL
jgi:hypothetical protein